MLSEKTNEFQMNLWVATLDYRKVFDSIWHDILWEALREQGVFTVHQSVTPAIFGTKCQGSNG
eukprot:1778793-Karenia_brevis.AAC.1